MGKDVTEELLRRYLAGECTPEEEECVEAWYQSLDGRSDVTGILDLIEDEQTESRIFERVKSQIDYSPQRERAIRIGTTRTETGMRVWRYAAVIAFFLLAGAGIFIFTDQTPDRTGQQTLSVVSNSENLIRRVALPDGSFIWLYPNSTVEFPSSFESAHRKLTLRGEAFFVVARDESRPFSINTSGVITTVLGTSFSIKAYDHEPSIEVEVLTGKVSVGLSDDTAKPIMLTSHQKATYRKGHATVEMEEETEKVATELAIWQTVDMSFDNASVAKVLQTLNEKFKVRIHVTSTNLLNCMIRADFNGQNLPDILEMLSKSINATYKYEGSIFYLEGEGCSN